LPGVVFPYPNCDAAIRQATPSKKPLAQKAHRCTGASLGSIAAATLVTGLIMTVSISWFPRGHRPAHIK
jgi:hypothetical protein